MPDKAYYHITAIWYLQFMIALAIAQATFGSVTPPRIPEALEA